MRKYILLYLLILPIMVACEKDKLVQPDTSFSVTDFKRSGDGFETPLKFELTFSQNPAETSAHENIYVVNSLGLKEPFDMAFSGTKITLTNSERLIEQASYTLIVWQDLQSASGAMIASGKSYPVAIGIDESDKFPTISDEELLNLVQRQTFRYFYENAHPVCGMPREISLPNSIDKVATGATGFGIMATIVAIERHFITRNEGFNHIRKIVSFLKDRCTTYHGAYSHWMNGNTGETWAYSEKDDGADLVETSFLIQGLLTARAYFDSEDAGEKDLCTDITSIWENVEWDWYLNEQKTQLRWHWSPNHGWEMGMPISGWNECFITYLLAMLSPTHSIPVDAYRYGWLADQQIVTNEEYYGLTLPFGREYGGPLFFTFFSFMDIDPHGLADMYGNDYEKQVFNQAKINYLYCIDNPKQYVGYGANCWGLSACNGNEGYVEFSPAKDYGVIAPYAAISAMPYTPDESMAALRYYYYKLGDRIWGDNGFVTGFNLSKKWYSTEYISVDEGPVIVMVENYRSKLLWNLFMNIPEIKDGLKRIGFSSDHIKN